MPYYCGGPTPPRIERVDDLARLPATEQIARVRPLLRKAGLTAVPDLSRHHEDNVPSALAELADEWGRDPRLAGRKVPFGEYVAMRIGAKLKEIDAEQRPECYDAHRRYVPSAVICAALAGDEPAPLSDQPGSSLDAPPTFGSALAMHPVASQAGVLRLLHGAAASTVTSGRQTGRALGLSSKEARAQPATQALLRARETVESMSAPERARLLQDPESFVLHVRPAGEAS